MEFLSRTYNVQTIHCPANPGDGWTRHTYQEEQLRRVCQQSYQLPQDLMSLSSTMQVRLGTWHLHMMLRLSHCSWY